LKRVGIALAAQLTGNFSDNIADEIIRNEKDQNAEIVLEILVDDGGAFLEKQCLALSAIQVPSVVRQVFLPLST
jgi:S-adenosylmethionine synthetase